MNEWMKMFVGGMCVCVGGGGGVLLSVNIE